MGQNEQNEQKLLKMDWKMSKNTVLGYKKGLKFQSDIGFEFGTPNLYILIFITFLLKWPEPWYLKGGKVGFPPFRLEKWRFERVSFDPVKML